MNSEIKKFLFDIRESIESIDIFLGDKWDFKVYKSDKMLRRAVERELEIIGEAMNRIGQLDPTIEISGKRQIISMRNRVIHSILTSHQFSLLTDLELHRESIEN
jgi:uncharacterized protein with HEPN domain